MKTRWFAVLLLLVVLAACGQEEEATPDMLTLTPLTQTPQPAVPTVSTPLPEPTAVPSLPDPLQSPLLPSQLAPANAAIDYLAPELGVAPETIQVLSVEEVTWPDTSLGCPQPGMAYAQVLTPGFLVRLQSGGQEYALHMDEDWGQIVLCEQADADVVSSPQGVFYTVLAYLTEAFPGFGLGQVGMWAFEDETLEGVLGSSTFAWYGGDWVLVLSFPAVPQPTYQATLSHSLAGVVWAGTLEGEQVSAVEEELFPTVEVSTCDESIAPDALDDWAEITVTAQEGAVHIEQNLSYVCCAELAIAAGREGNVIRIIETNVGEICRCMCGYPLVIDLAGLPAGDYTVEVWGVQYYNVQPLEFLGSAAVAIP